MKIATITLLTVIGLSAIGCASSPRTTAPLGQSVRANSQKQVLNPGTPDMTPIMGLDGNYADAAYKSYLKSAGAEKKSQNKPEAFLVTPGSEGGQ